MRGELATELTEGIHKIKEVYIMWYLRNLFLFLKYKLHIAKLGIDFIVPGNDDE